MYRSSVDINSHYGHSCTLIADSNDVTIRSRPHLQGGSRHESCSHSSSTLCRQVLVPAQPLVALQVMKINDTYTNAVSIYIYIYTYTAQHAKT